MFEQKNWKYRVLKIVKKSAVNEGLVPFDKNNVPATTIANPLLVNLLMRTTDLSMFKQFRIQSQVDTEVYNLSCIDTGLLKEANEILDEISYYIDKVQKHH